MAKQINNKKKGEDKIPHYGATKADPISYSVADKDLSELVAHPDKLHYLHHLCKSTLTISINPQRDVCQSASSFLLSDKFYAPYIKTGSDIYKQVVSRDSLISIRFLSGGNIFCVIHHDLNHALDEAIKILEK